MQILIVVNNSAEWPFHIPGVEVVDARTYLTKPEYGELRGIKLFNLCRSYRYQSLGYYVTLLATARGHKPLPNIMSLQDLKSQTVVRFVSDDLDELIQRSLAPIESEKFTLSIYFGRNLARRYERLSLHLFNLFQVPLLRAQFVNNGKWQLRTIDPVPIDEIPEQHKPFVMEVASEHFAGRRISLPKQKPAKYDLAILVNPEELMPPSDEKALQRFAKAAEAKGLHTELIGRDDYARLAEFDALFIRETTNVSHHTYRFARRAAIEGLVVIDDPESILKCSNKVYLAELLGRHKVPVPRTLVVHKDNIGLVGEELGFPCILKQPDAAFSQGVVKIENEDAMANCAELFLAKSDLVIAQEFLPTTFDWRIGILDRQPLYACKYHMVEKHWQITQKDDRGQRRYGRTETLPVQQVPRHIIKTALKAANLIGNGLYGVDVKQVGRQSFLIEVNDNPNIDAGVEDDFLKEELYDRIMDVFLERIDDSQSRHEGSVSEHRLELFAAYGVELEYMIVDAGTLSVRPIADELLRDAAGGHEYVSDVEHDDIPWSNELVAHVIELKTTDPAPDLAALPAAFQREVGEINRLLAPHGARLLPSAMHPWMDPARETRIWPHDNSVVYRSFDRVFGCQGHGWSNLQSVHLNLPFADDDQFGRLHAAVRLLLPILPVLAASSPLVEGRPTGWLDSRLDVYRSNSQKIPSIAGRVIPEPVFTAADYDREIFQQIYADIAPHDPEGILQDEWLNARGAIARFGRGSIEIRVLDVQECPRADLAICAAVVAVLQALVAEEWTSLADQQRWPVEPLAAIFLATARDAEAAPIENVDYLRALGLQTSRGCSAGELWRHLLAVCRDRLGQSASPWLDTWNVLADEGPLARRILRRLGDAGPSPPREQLYNLYRKLAECLAEGQML